MENEKPKRKDLRLKQYNYSTNGAYFITVCTKDRKNILSHIAVVGVGAHDDPKKGAHDDPRRGAHDDPSETDKQKQNFAGGMQPQLTNIGRIIEKNLLSSEKISGVKIDRYVIMPDHIHVIIFIDSDKYIYGSSKAPTPTNEMIPHIVSTFKRFCTKEIGENIFQRGYFDHIIRNREDYEEHVKYIYENPMKWNFEKGQTNG